MRKGIGPQGLGAPSSPAKQVSYPAPSPNMGRLRSDAAAGDKEAQQKINEHTSSKIKARHKGETGAIAYEATKEMHKNKFGVKKSKMNIK